MDDEEDNDDEDLYADLPDDAEAEEAAAEQRALLMSFETQHRDEAARHFMHAERSAAAERLGGAQATAHANAHRRNIEAARAAMVVAEQRLAEGIGAGASVGGSGTPSPRKPVPYIPTRHGRSARRRGGRWSHSSRMPSAAAASGWRRSTIAATVTTHARPTTALAHQTMCHHHRTPKPPATMTPSFRYRLVLVKFRRIM
jgi:hypothetical protein